MKSYQIFKAASFVALLASGCKNIAEESYTPTAESPSTISAAKVVKEDPICSETNKVTKFGVWSKYCTDYATTNFGGGCDWYGGNAKDFPTKATTIGKNLTADKKTKFELTTKPTSIKKGSIIVWTYSTWGHVSIADADPVSSIITDSKTKNSKKIWSMKISEMNMGAFPKPLCSLEPARTLNFGKVTSNTATWDDGATTFYHPSVSKNGMPFNTAILPTIQKKN